MYDSTPVLAALDENMWKVLALCGLAMACNYTWFIAAVRQGLRDQTVPIPIFCTLFWLAGDASMVARYERWFVEIDHWYVKLFWAALVLTVINELVFLWLTLRFGRKEFAPRLTQPQFTALVLAWLGTMALGFELVKEWIGDPLYINYFHLANLIGPPFAAAMVVRRGTRAGTSPLIWGAYTAMVASWFTATALWFGDAFTTPGHFALYAVSTASAAGMFLFVRRLPAPSTARASV
ncbi:MAG: hypothetical protein FJ091_15460 [Deltaproteobacteria bacterium]|nr:hypothetical protein [Deltaproteobacteria bacterium]